MVDTRVEIKSLLAKIAQLLQFSQQFPILVRTACTLEGVEYSDQILQAVAMNSTILAEIPYWQGQSIDAAILEIFQDAQRAHQLDQDIRYVVTTTKEPAGAPDADTRTD